jgi:hypothetical protein
VSSQQLQDQLQKQHNTYAYKYIWEQDKHKDYSQKFNLGRSSEVEVQVVTLNNDNNKGKVAVIN